MSSSYRIELDNWISNLDVAADCVLDIGGSQLPVKGRTKSWNVKEYYIGDMADPHVDSPKPNFVIDLNKSQALGDYLGMGNVVFCLEVFDYVYRPELALKSLKKILAPGGDLWVTFPSIYPLHNPHEDDALRYMPGGIRKLAELVGLQVKEMIPRKFETRAWEQAYRIERMRAAKHQDHNFSGWIVRFTK